MKKLNKKGFTLIELLAVIVVLAIVLVVTIPAVLSSMDTAREKQFNNAVKTVEEYIRKQLEACNIGDTTLAQYDTTLFVQGENGCVVANQNTGTAQNPRYEVIQSTVASIVQAAGYTYVSSCEDSNGDPVESDLCDFNILLDGTVSHAASSSASKFREQDI